MRSVALSGDLTAKARIRDAAVTAFAREGFTVPVRAIAQAAQVSPASVIHHFGSKDGLRDACDAYVLDQIMTMKQDAAHGDHMVNFGQFARDLTAITEPVAYLLRALLAGGDRARSVLARTVALTQAYLDVAVAEGSVLASREPEARAKYLAYSSLGMAVMAFLAADSSHGSAENRPASKPSTPPYAAVTRALEELAVPHIELLTQGLLTSHELLTSITTPKGSAP